jgi:hypothetical protein
MPEALSPIRVSIPFEVAGNLGNFKKAVGSILDKLGCQACCSGFDIRFEIERDFHVDHDLQVRSFAAAGFAPAKLATQAFAGRSVVLNDAVANNSGSLMKAIDNIAKLSGCQACCSGIDLQFLRQRDFMVDSKINVGGI